MKIIKLLLISSIILINSCGTLGGTKVFTVRQDIPQKVDISFKLKEIELEDDGSKTVSVGAYKFSGYDNSTATNLKKSIENSIKKIKAPRNNANIDLYITIRKYYIVASNNAGAGLICVSWALANNDNLIFNDQFYVSNKAVLTKTVGRIKNEMHESIIRRILTYSVLAINSPINSMIKRPVINNTYDNFNDAIKVLPETFESMGIFNRDENWQWAAITDELDWKRKINK